MDEQELREAVAELVDDWYTGEVASRVSVAPDARDDLKERIAGFVRGEQAEIKRLRAQLDAARAWARTWKLAARSFREDYHAETGWTSIYMLQADASLTLLRRLDAEAKRLRDACRAALKHWYSSDAFGYGAPEDDAVVTQVKTALGKEAKTKVGEQARKSIYRAG